MAPSIEFAKITTATVEFDAPAHRQFAVLADSSIITAVATGASPRHIQIWRSRDNGLTWTVIHDDTTTTNGYPGPILHWPGGIIAACYCDAADFVSPSFAGVVRIKRSTDNGASWSTVATFTPGNLAAHINNLAYDGVTFTKSGGIIVGFFTQQSGSTTKDYWRTTDKGATWSGPSRLNNNARAHTYTLSITNASGKVIAGQGSDTNAAFTTIVAPTVRTSTDHGATWSNGGTIPNLNGNNANYEFGHFAAFDANTIIIGGSCGGITAGGNAPLWRTTDAGATWALVAASNINNFSPSNNFPIINAVCRLTENVGLLAYSPRQGSDPVPWRLTHDAGATFPISATATSTVNATQGSQSSAFCKTPDGHVLCWYTSTSGKELWRGTITC
jgi:hypothetical protein